MHRWTEEEKKFLAEFTPGHSHKEILNALNSRFDLNISDGAMKGALKRFGFKTGRTGQFEKGYVPVNKGKKMPKEIYEKCKGTMFKKGEKPVNTDPIGTEKLLSDGYVWVKIKDDVKAPKKNNWRQKHRIVWEEHYGEIPEGHVIIFLDRDRLNFDIDNLKCITRNQEVRMNQQGLFFENAEATKTGVIIADLHVKLGEIKRKKKNGGAT